MTIDIVFGALVLIWALRGYSKGFLVQAITLAGLVGAVYLADPLRSLVRPYVQPHFTSIEPGLFDIGLWWGAVVVSYLVTVGIALGFVKAQKRKPYPVTEPNRGDKGAGFLVGAAKGFVLCAFLASGINRYAPTYLESNSVLSDQTQKSRSLSWAKEHRVAEVIWEAAPVQNFVTRVKERGFWPANGEEKRASAGAPSSRNAVEDPATTASRPSEASKNLAIPPSVRQDLEQIENRLRELHNEAESIQSR